MNCDRMTMSDSSIWRTRTFQATRADAEKWYAQPEERRKKFCLRFLYIDRNFDWEIEFNTARHIPGYSHPSVMAVKMLEDKFKFWMAKEIKDEQRKMELQNEN